MESQNQYEEVSLVELIVMWLKNWKLAVASGFVVAVLLASLVSILAPKYDSKVSLQIGSLGEDFIVSPAVLVSRFKAFYRVGDDSQGERVMPRLEKISSNKRNESPVVEFTARAHDAESAAEFLSVLTQKIIQDHLEEYKASRKQKQDLYEKLSEQGGDNGAVLSKIQNELAVIHPSKLLAPPSVPVKPTSPNKPLLYAVSLMLGLIVMLILPFVLAFIASVKEELQRQANQ